MRGPRAPRARPPRSNQPVARRGLAQTQQRLHEYARGHEAEGARSRQHFFAGDGRRECRRPRERGKCAPSSRSLLAALKPTSLTVRDDSDDGSESRFHLDIVADCFEPLAPEKREQLVLVLLGEVGASCTADVNARAPSELA